MQSKSDQRIENTPKREYAALVMKRPRGVTVMAFIFLFMAIAALNALVTVSSGGLPKGRLLGMLLANLLITVTLGVALLKMQNWSRWVCIVACATMLVFVPWEVVRGHDMVSLVRAGLRTLFFVWVIWYLSQPQVRAAFRSP